MVLLDQTLRCLSPIMIRKQHFHFPPYRPHFRVVCWEYSGRGDQGIVNAGPLNKRTVGSRTGDKHREKDRVHPHSIAGECSYVFSNNISEVMIAIPHFKETFKKPNNR